MQIKGICLLIALQWRLLNACGIAVHNEITYRSLERFETSDELHILYKNTILDSPEYSQSGSFFPDWGYNCLGYNQQSEDAHWPTFIKTAVNYVREVYPKSEFHNNPHGLISFIMSTMSHGLADVKWHSLSGLSDYFIVAMANSDFHGNQKEAHTAADTGAEFTLRHSSPLSYLNKTWKIPIKDLVAIYKRLYAQSSTRVPLKEHIQYCMATAFAASKVDVEFGQWMFGYFGAKSPFLVEELYDYYRGGIHDLSNSVSACYPQMIDAFEHGVTFSHPDTLCADYFNTLQKTPHCHHDTKLSKKLDDTVQQMYDTETGVLTLTTLDLPEVAAQTVMTPHLPSRCLPLNATTLTLSSGSWGVGHQTSLGHFGLHWDLAISAPYYQQTGAVFLLNRTSLAQGGQELSEVTHTILQEVCGRFGWATLTLDINQDGLDDLAVACPSDQDGRVYLYFGSLTGLSRLPNVTIELGYPGTVLAKMNTDGYDDLMVGCPLCQIKDDFQTGLVDVYKSRPIFGSMLVKADIRLKNPNRGAYDRFGESILTLNDLVLIGAPGFSLGKNQKVGKVYALDRRTLRLKWTMVGEKEFQQFGRVMATNNENMLAISSPSEETTVGLKKHWQAGTVRIYDVKQIELDFPINRNMVYGMIKLYEGKTNAGHFGQSLSITDQDVLWIGEPMSEKENGRVYKLNFQENELQCLENGVGLARFGSQIEQLGKEVTCITSQRYGQNSQFSGAVHFVLN
ncbi:Glycosylphosphatidylinositol specific phospholipase D1 [Rhizopus stolonifer]|uniref:Phosphatidylinositol-glycan-specific phospholipase D n=1 Tax=Rhizopus stolonifer TaxID=4846 RepID=A0A367KKY5_RHIST|nr:Glycosylphosphatidylinositol specific phospholipase D1 [Rhizopus stolonifer]